MRNLIPGINEVIPRIYQEQENDFGFEVIIEKFISSVPSVEEPEFVHMLGIPAAGKSTYYKANKDKYCDYVFVGFDFIMMAHPGYQNDVLSLGSIEAFKKWELPARIAGYELLRRAIETKKNIFFDHGGTPKCHQELLKNVKALGYTTKMFYIYCDVETAIKRAKIREIDTKRHTPEEMIRERLLLVEQSKQIYEKIVDEFVEL